MNRRDLLGQFCALAPVSIGLGTTDDGHGRIDAVDAQGMAEWDRINLERNLRWILSRERASQPDLATVGVFADAGVWHVGAWSIVTAIEQESTPCRVLDRSMLRKTELDRLVAIVLPGGWAPYQWAAIAEVGFAALKSYVEGGGRCLGICAGAYLLSRTTHYDGKAYPYPLGLFDGTAKGPVEGLARFPKPGEARLSITEEGQRRGLTALSDEPLYYSGGPWFLGGTEIEVLARFQDGSPAAIGREVGKGEVVLIGAHPERPRPERGGDDEPPPASAGKTLRTLLSLGK